MRYLSIGLILCVAASAAGPGVTGPLAGFFLDSDARALRPVLGIPGAAYSGELILGDVRAAAVAPDGATALVASKESLLLVRRLPTTEFTAAAIGGGLAGASLLAWSADGSTAVAYAPASRSVQVLRGARVEREIELTSLDGLTALAVSDSGETLLAAAAEGLYAISGGEARRIAQLGAVSAIVLRGGDAFVAGAGLFEIADYAGNAAVLPFAGDVAAVGLQLTPDNQRLIAATADSVLIYDIGSRTVAARLELTFAPATLARFGAPATFLLKSGKAGQEPMYVIDVAAAAGPAVYFVPAGGENQ